MRITVFGAGAIGGQIAVRLALGGASVSAVARGAQLDAIRTDGLRLIAGGKVLAALVQASADPAEIGQQDAVFVCVKAPALPVVARTIAPLLRPETPVVFVNNGLPWWYFLRHGGPLDGRALDALDPGGVLARNVGAARTLGAVIYAACDVREPGLVVLNSAEARLVLGELDGAISPRARALAEVLGRGGLATTVSPTLRDEVWGKLVTNMGPGLLALLGAAPIDVIARDPACRALLRTLSLEAMALARGLGRTPAFDLESKLQSWQRLHHKPSLLQDLERGRKPEMAAMFTAPLALAEAAGVSVPNLTQLAALAQLRVDATADT